MIQTVLFHVFWTYVSLTSSWPVDDKPGFSHWKRAGDLRKIDALEFSGLEGKQLGLGEHAKFEVKDPTCREHLPGDEKCWTMDKITVDKMNDARKKEANEFEGKCLFYTASLSGAAERRANAVLWDVLVSQTVKAEPPTEAFQTIWALHEKKYYPDNMRNPGGTPELDCIFKDAKKEDKTTHFNGCQRLYFKSMSKAMATQCKGEVFVMTMSNVAGLKLEPVENIPDDGIWWQVEFPTLIDNANRPKDKQVTKITYIQVPYKTPSQIEALRKNGKIEPPKQLARGTYWPGAGTPGQNQLDAKKGGSGKRSNTQRSYDSDASDAKEDSQPEYNASSVEFVKRAGPVELCKFGEKCYDLPYKIEDMWDMYKGLF